MESCRHCEMVELLFAHNTTGSNIKHQCGKCVTVLFHYGFTLIPRDVLNDDGIHHNVSVGRSGQC